MKVTAALLVSGVFAVNAYARPQEASTTEAPAATTSAAMTPTETCLAACSLGDVSCQAVCLGVPNPDESMVNQTTQCSEKCDQGNGSPADTQAYGDCLAACRTSYFFSTGMAAMPTAGVSSAESGAAVATATATGSNSKATDAGM